MKKFFLLLPLFALLSACTPPLTRSQQLAIYRTRCLEYGYEPGTVEFADCMKEQEKRDEDLALQERKIRALEEKNHLKKRRVEAKEKEATKGKFKFDW